MNKIYFCLKIFAIYFFIISSVLAAQSNYLERGKILFKKKEYDKSKILFEKDIVFNPKSEISYLYLAKIYNKNNDDIGQEMKLNNVLLLNPKNDEAMYMLILLKIKQSDYNEAKKLISEFNLICVSFCSKKTEMQQKLDKLAPENAKDKN